MRNSLSRDIRQCTAAGMQLCRVKQKNHNPFTDTEISRGAFGGADDRLFVVCRGSS
jgi:hypothetical protein